MSCIENVTEAKVQKYRHQNILLIPTARVTNADASVPVMEHN